MILQITCRNFENTESIKTAVNNYVQKLTKLFDGIVSCHVVLSSPHRHQSQGRVFHIQIALTVPKKKIVVNRETENSGSHEIFHVALRDAFHAMEHQLETYIYKQSATGRRHINSNDAMNELTL